jgi:amino acid adenylation domain-containing protein
MEKIPFQKRLDESFKKHGTRTAIEWGPRVITYSQLEKNAGYISDWISREGIKSGSFIGICLADKIDLISMMIAILKARCVFVILDTELPAKRIQTMIRLTHTRILFLDAKNKKKLFGGSDNNRIEKTVQAIIPDNFIYKKGDLGSWPVTRRGNGGEYHREDKIYIYFTSGSSGTPKAILGKNKSLLHFIDWEIETFGIDETFRVSQLNSPGFDAFLRDVFTPLCAGAALCIPESKDTVMHRQALVNWIDREQIRLIHCVPSVFRIFNSRDLVTGNFKSLKYVLLSGERLIPHELTHWFNVFADRIQLVNLYGTSETTMVKTCYFIKESDTRKSRIPVGKPIKGSRLFILDESFKVCAKEFTGEIYIRTPFMTFGYYNDPQANKEKFIPNPFTNDPNDNFHKTGDLGRVLEDGNIDVLGRIDGQVKIRGIRIELEEIESAILKHTAVDEALVIDREDTAGDRYLCAYFVSQREITPEECREYLSMDLPAYMIPSYFMPLRSIPVTSNGKIDRSALPEPQLKAGDDYIPPRDNLEKKLVEIWSEVLGLENHFIGINHNFFQLGGHSLKAVFMIEKVHKKLNVKLRLTEVFRKTNIRELAEYISGLTTDIFTAIEPVEKRDHYALASAQKRLYILQQMDLSGTVYNMTQIIPLTVEPDPQQMEWSFKQLIQRHESLRTSFHMLEDQPVQKVHDEVAFEIEYYETGKRQKAKGNKEELMPESLIKDFIRAFDLSRAPLLRVGLIKTENETYLLMVDMHHIISDGVSLDILERDFITIYTRGRLSPLKIQYKDFSQWQNSEKEKKNIKQQENYWLEEFEREVPILNMPTDYTRPEIRSFEGNSLDFEISGGHTDILKRIALEENATLYMVLLAVYNVLLSKLSGQDEIVIGAPIAGRRHADLDNIIGMFVNTLVLRNYPKPGKSFNEFLSHLKEKTLEAFENQDYQFEDLVEKAAVNIKRDAGRNPLFDVVYILQNIADIPTETPGPEQQQGFKPDNRTAKFDITLMAIEKTNSLHIFFQYCTKLFKKETIQRFITYFKNIVSCIVKESTLKLSGIEIISKEEKKQLLVDFNNTESIYPKDKTIPGLFAEQVEKTPDNTALIGQIPNKAESSGQVLNAFGDIQLSYSELNEEANRLAFYLKEKGVKPDTIVGIMVERSLRMIIGILGILKSGGAYLPIDPEYPEERITYMLKDSNAKILLKENDFTLEAFNNCPKGTSSYLHLSPAPVTSLAYVIYTSGSTGGPKGVLTTHYNVIRVVRNTNYIEIRPGDRLLQLSNYAFDGSVFDIYGALLNGALLVLITGEKAADVDRLAGVIKKQSIDVFFVTTALFNLMVDQDPGIFHHIRKVLFGGEWVSVHYTRRALQYAGEDKIIHVYGPTETTVYATYFLVNKIAANTGTIPIGSPLANTSIYILDAYFAAIPIGITGELYIGGDGTARGYLNNPELTFERFKRVVISHSSLIISSSKKLSKSTNDQCPMTNDRLYKTGDLGRWLPEGNIEFSGRIDQQVKIRGHRIEPGEIENQLTAIDYIKEAVVIDREDASGEKSLYAYIVPVENEEVGIPQLKDRLSVALPAFMIPSYFMQLEKIPLTPNGKVDRKALPTLEFKAGENYLPPRNKIEEKLVEIWSEVLGIEKNSISISGDFFELGGHSLKATIMAAKIHKALNVKVPLAEIFRTPVIKELSGYIKGIAPNKYISIEPVEKKAFYPLSSAQKRLYIQQHMVKDNLSYNVTMVVNLEGKLERERLEEVFKKVIKRHESFRTSFHVLDEQPVQKIHNEVEFFVDYHERKAEETEELAKSFIRPFDLSKAPLLRVRLVRVEDSRSILMVDIHHIITDGTSMVILLKEFMVLYEGRELQPLIIQYKDFSAWQNREKESRGIKKQEEYWLEQFETRIPPLNLPTDYVRPTVHSYEGKAIGFELGRAETQSLKKMALRDGTTLYMMLLALFNVLLAKACDQEDIIIGAPLVGRRHTDLEPVIGFFVNMLPLRNYPSKEKIFREFLLEVKERTLKAYDNQDYQFEDLVDNVLSNRETGHDSLVDVVFVFQNMEVLPGKIPEAEIPGLSLMPYQHEIKTSPFDITLLGAERGDKLSFSLKYKTTLFKNETVRLLVRNFKEVVSAVLNNTAIKLKDIVTTHDLLAVKPGASREEQGDFVFF